MAVKSLYAAIKEALDREGLVYKHVSPNQIAVDIPKETANEASERLVHAKLYLLKQGVKIVDEVICFRNRLSFTVTCRDRTVLILPNF